GDGGDRGRFPLPALAYRDAKDLAHLDISFLRRPCACANRRDGTRRHPTVSRNLPDWQSRAQATERLCQDMRHARFSDTAPRRRGRAMLEWRGHVKARVAKQQEAQMANWQDELESLLASFDVALEAPAPERQGMADGPDEYLLARLEPGDSL